MTQRILAAVLCLCLLLGGLGFRVEAADVIASGSCGDSVKWTLDSDGVLTIRGSGKMYSNLVCAPWYSQRESIRSVVIEQAVTSIGYRAFYGCSSLTSITIPEGVTSIGNSAFYGCSRLASLFFNGDAPTIDTTAFIDVNAVAFYPAGNATWESKKLDYGGTLYWSAMELNTEIIATSICGENMMWQLSKGGVLTIKGSGTFKDFTLWESYKPMIQQVIFSAAIEVPTIPANSFYRYQHLRTITLPDSVTSIGDYAFSSCSSLTSITIPKSVTSIGYWAFSDCSSLTSITIPDGVTSIGNWAFYGCTSLTGIWVGKCNPNYSNDENGVLYNKEKTRLIQCPGGLSGTYAIPDSVTSIGNYAFYGCSSLTSIIIPDSVTSIGNRAFCGCSSLTSITIPEGVTSIGDKAFSGCSSLTSITIPESVTSIGDKAFGSCNSLKVVAFLGEKPSINSSAFAGVTADAYYPESLDSDSSWKKSGALSGYGGMLNWKPWYTLGDNLFCEHVLEDTVVPPTCTWGYTLHKCACGYSYRTDFEPGSGHDMITDAAVPATCTETGLTEGSHCLRCDYKIAQEVTPKLGHDMITDAAVPATCTETGLTEGSHCSRCDYKIAQEVTPKLGHDMITDAAVPATCTETGLTEGSHCSRCDYKVAQQTTPKLGHDWGDPVYEWADDHSAITATRVCKRDPAHAETENGVVTSAVTKEATYDAEGEITYTATFANPAFEPQTAVVSLPRLERPTPTPAENPFADIRESAYYHDPVLWAVANNVTNGTSDSTFSPDEGCTRAQVVTFLWRTAGKPDPASSKSPFSDVKEDAYYYNAVLWAVEKGITNGTSDKTFSPDETCTRAQIVTFLWRYEEQPAPAGTNNPFADVKPSAYFDSAVLWAVETGITNGTSATTFDPEDTCTRAQVVTFLYRDIVKS